MQGGSADKKKVIAMGLCRRKGGEGGRYPTIYCIHGRILSLNITGFFPNELIPQTSYEEAGGKQERIKGKQKERIRSPCPEMFGEELLWSCCFRFVQVHINGGKNGLG